MTFVYRAPLSLGLCGFGGDRDSERLARRIERFAEVPDGSFVWSRDSDGRYRLGRLCGRYAYDRGGEDVDLVHVLPCEWRPESVVESDAPPAVVAAFGRGGRNFQQIHDATVPLRQRFSEPVDLGLVVLEQHRFLGREVTEEGALGDDMPISIDGLYLGGAACHGGPGIRFIPGYNAAHQALDDN